MQEDFDYEIEENVVVAFEIPELPLLSHDSRPVRDSDIRSPLQSKTSQERARERMDQHVVHMNQWSIRDRETPPYYRNEHGNYYMPHIKFGPGRFKDWWPDSSIYFRALVSSLIGFFPTNGRRNKMSGMSGNRTKKKPPD